MPYVRPDVQAFLDTSAAQGAPPLEAMDVDVARQMYGALAGMADRPRGELAHVHELTIPSPHGHSIPARLYHDAPVADGPLLLFYHGGGWVIGDLQTHDGLCAEIARQLSMPVLSVDYRLAPEHRFPAAAEDALAAAAWAGSASSRDTLGFTPTGLVVAGDSAGGNLSAVVAQHHEGAVPVIAQWLIYPGVDMTATGGSMDEYADGYALTVEGMNWFGRHYLGEDGQAHAAHAYASPGHRETLHGQPPALVFTCGLDPLRDQGRAYAARLVGAGVQTRFREAPGQIHGCFNLRGAIPSAQDDLLANLADLKAMLAEARA